MGCHPEGAYSGSVGTCIKGSDGMTGMLWCVLVAAAAEGIEWCNTMTEVNPCTGKPRDMTKAGPAS